MDIDIVLKQYETIEHGLTLKYEKLDAKIDFQPILQEPPNYHPLLVTSHEDDTIGLILPKRNTAFRVWSKLNTDKSWLNDIKNDCFDKNLAKISKKYLGYDLASMPEHIGNTYLCAANPILRHWHPFLLDNGKTLAVIFHEREGKSVEGCKLVFEEERAKKIGFTVEAKISNQHERIALPYPPAAHHIKLYDSQGCLLESHSGVFIEEIEFNMSIGQNRVDYEIETKKGEVLTKYSVQKYSDAGSVNMGKRMSSMAHYLSEAVTQRKHKKLEANKEFIFFPPKPESKERAKEAICEILNRARKRCMILDPYFGTRDLEYVFKIKNISVPIQIISSAMFLNEKVEKLSETTNAKILLDALHSYKEQYSSQQIECRVLRGNRSPLHDRYLVVDEAVYLLGSSLNEFGSRATTLIKVPTPIPMVEQALQWWGDNVICPLITDYIQKPIDENETRP